MKRVIRLLPLVGLVLSLAAPILAADFRHSTPAVSGYDVVSFQTGEKPLRGNGNHVAVHDGATYLFVNDANKRTFEKDPERYAPAYGGYCAYGVAVGKKFVGDPDVWKVVDDRLYLNLDTKIQETWSKDISGNIRKADGQWTKIEGSDPASL
ncbi:MAG: YHS domain-containing (seleno)protein [Myxococcota bacterium]